MRIALINDNSQASKNEIIYKALKKVCDNKEYELYNLGMTCNEDPVLTYVGNGLMAGILLNSKAIDFVVTGCGTGEGAMMALNSFPNVECGLVVDPTDAYLFSQINAGNAISIPYAKGFGWGSELTLENIFNKLFETEAGGGYPEERKESEQRNKKVLDYVKSVTIKDMLEILKEIDKNFLMEVINRDSFKEFLYNKMPECEIKSYLVNFLANN